LKKAIITIIIIALVGLGGYYAIKALFPESETVTGPTYSTYEVGRGNISVGVSASGYLNPSYGGYMSVPWSNSPNAPSSYIIDKLYFKMGDVLKAGDVVMELSAPSLTVTIESLQRQINQQRQTLASMLNIPVEGAEYANPDDGITIFAPISGRLEGFSIKEGTKVFQGGVVARIINDSELVMTAKLTKGEIDRLTDKHKVVIRMPGIFAMDEFVVGDILSINRSAIVEPSNTLMLPSGQVSAQEGYEFVYWVTVKVANPGLLAPGMTATVGFYDPAVIDLPAVGMAQGTHSVMWIRYASTIEKYADEQTVMSTMEGVVTKVLTTDRSVVNAGDPLIVMAGQDVRAAINAIITDINEKKIQLMELQSQLSGLVIYAPSDGILSDLDSSIRQGASISPGNWIGSIFRVDDMNMSVMVDDVDIVLVQVGAAVSVTLDALPGQVFEGKVTEVSSSGGGEGANRFYVYITVIGNSDIRSGMQAKAYIGAGSTENALLVPLEAVFRENNQNKVEILDENGVPKTVIVEIGLMNNRYAEVISGLNDGDLVITGSTGDTLNSMSGGGSSTGGLFPSGK